MRTQKIFLGICSVVLLLLGGSLSSCQKRYEELQVDPNKPTKSAPINLLHWLVRQTWENPWDDASKYSQFWVTGYKLYGHQNYMFGRYNMNYSELRNIDQMIKEADDTGFEDNLAFRPIGKFLKAFFYIRMSERLGDVPFSEAMQGASKENFTPKYDTQKEVYAACLQLLEEANAEIAPCVAEKYSIGKDLYFGGDLLKWQKAINTFRVRVLISLSRRAAEMNVAEQLQKMVSDPVKYPLMESNNDNMQITFPGGTNDRYPCYPDETRQHRQRNAIGEVYVSLLRKYQDPRIFIQMEPGVNAGDPTLFASYKGANSGDDMTVIAQGLNNGEYATISYALYVTPTGIPCVQLGYSELQFSLAEAVNRGWVAGDAATYYQNGIRADMQFYGVKEEAVVAFLARPENIYAGNDAAGLQMILEQKYVAFFQNSGYQAFFEQRRTGVPSFHVGPGNDNGAIPVRWMYPEAERLYNGDNLRASLQRQFSGSDNINDRMWLIQ